MCDSHKVSMHDIALLLVKVGGKLQTFFFVF